MKKIIPEKTSSGEPTGKYVTADATPVDLINPTVALDEATSPVRALLYVFATWLLAR